MTPMTLITICETRRDITVLLERGETEHYLTPPSSSIITVKARATYRLVGKVFVYGGFESLQEAYLLADRENVSDRFMGFEKRLIGGVRWDVWERATLEASAGYAFDRYYGVGKNQIGNLHDQVDIAPGDFASVNFQILF